MSWVTEYDISALVLLSVLFWILFQQKSFPSATSRSFRLLLIFAWLFTFLDLVAIVTIKYADFLPLWVNYLSQILYSLTYNSTTFIYYIYVLSMTQEHRIIQRSKKWVIIIPLVFVYLLILTTPFTHLVFYFDENLQYRNGTGLYILYGIALIFMLLSFFDTIKYQKMLTRIQKLAVFTYTFSCIISFFLQLLFRNLMIIGFAVAVSSLLAYLSIQNPDDFIDQPTGAFNLKAFHSTLKTMFRQGDKLTILCLELKDYNYLHQTLGMNTSDTVTLSVAHLLQKSAPDRLYRLSDSRFALILKHKEPDLDTILKTISNYFETPCFVNGTELRPTPLICVIHCPECANYAEDVADLMDYSLEHAELLSDTVPIVYADDTSIIMKRREAAIRHILQRAVQNNEFEVYYQPVYSINEQRFESVEALIRLHDAAFGDISPDEFLPVAEKNGYILKIGSLVFDKVYSFIAKTSLWKYGIRYVGINLSVVQCLQESLRDQLNERVARYNIPPSMIALEFNELSVVNVKDRFLKKAALLSQDGFGFSLDHRGIGCSGEDFFSLPVRCVKFDRGIILSAMKNDRTRIAMKHTITMYNELSLRVAAVGVESKEEAEELALYGCYYQQGYYYSMPVKEEELIRLISH